MSTIIFRKKIMRATSIEILERIKIFYKLKSDGDIASFFEVSIQAVSNWKTRNNLNFELIFEKCEGINYHWLFTGQYPNPSREKRMEYIETQRDVLNLLLEKSMELHSGIAKDPEKTKSEMKILKKASELLEIMEKNQIKQ